MRLLDGRRPDQFGCGGALWTRPSVQQLLQQRFQVSLSVLSISMLLKRLGLALPGRLGQMSPQSPSDSSSWLGGVGQHQVNTLARQQSADLLFWHCCRLQPVADAESARTPVTRAIVLLVGVQGAFWLASYDEPMTPVQLQKVLARLMRGRKRPVLLAMNGCAGQLTQAALAQAASSRGRLRIHLAENS